MTADINTDSVFNRYLEYVIKHPTFGADETSYIIEIQTKGNKLYTIHAHSFAYQRFYFLPWHVGKVKNYDPEITRIFEKVTANPEFEKWNTRLFISNFLFRIYFERYRNRFNWEDIKISYPDAFRSLNKNFIPVEIGTSTKEPAKAGLDKRYNIRFKLRNTELNVLVDHSFNANDIDNVNRVEKFGDTVKWLLKNSNFLFKYLRERPKVKLVFSPARNAAYGKYTYGSIAKFFPGFANYNYNDIQMVEVTGDPDIQSTWLLLPDSTLLLCRYQTSLDRTQTPISPPFMGLDENLIKKHYKNSHSVCLHFDANGTLIRDLGDGLKIYFPY
ncbi:hypothetical protein GCM10028827_22350 [Mucilaginibacter myungsuensis]